MAADFNNVDDILKQWASAGPKEPRADKPEEAANPFAGTVITVRCSNGESYEFAPGSQVMDLGSRIMVSVGPKDVTVFNSDEVVFYELAEVAEESEEASE